MGFDASDSAMRPRAHPPLVEFVSRPLPLPPRLAFVKTPVWDEASADTQEAFAELVEALGEHVTEVTLPEPFKDAIALHRTIMESDLALSFAPEYENGADQLSEVLRAMIERGRTYLALDYNRAVGRIQVYNAALDDVFHEMDVIVTPATQGEAPRGLGSTGSPAFCTLWTLCGLPALVTG